jgi:selenocysteine lyase/cysteine desulfurase
VIDVAAVRSHFPALQSGTLFFDNPAGTQIARESLERIQAYLVGMNANHGGAYRGSRASDALVLEARRAAADLLGSKPEEIVFGPNMTTLTLHMSRSLARELKAGDEIVLTRLDHDANVSPGSWRSAWPPMLRGPSTRSPRRSAWRMRPALCALWMRCITPRTA